MSFNLVRYNIAPYNRPSDSDIYLIVTGSETITTSIGKGLNYYGLVIGNEKVNKFLPGGIPVKFLEAEFNEDIEENVVEAQASVILSPVFSEIVDSDIYLAAEVRPSLTMIENVMDDITVNANLYLVSQGMEEIDKKLLLGSRTYIIAEGYEFIDSLASLRNINIKVCVLTTTLKPGDMLIVDANNYNVLLNQQNKIEIQSGDWIDELNRNTTEIKLTASSGMANMSATILYTEKYL